MDKTGKNRLKLRGVVVRGAAGWVVWQLVAAMGEDGGRVIRVRSSADPVSRREGGRCSSASGTLLLGT